MIRNIFQAGIIGSALVGGAFVEAALPIWIAEKMSTATHTMSSDEYGSLQGWRNCMSEGWKSAKTTDARSLHKSCNTKVAAYQDGTLQITNIKLDDGSYCSGPHAGNLRRFSGQINNPTTDVYLTNFSWFARYPQADKPASGAGHVYDKMLAPGESKAICLFTLKFDSTAAAAHYDANPLLLAATVAVERGVVDRD